MKAASRWFRRTFHQATMKPRRFHKTSTIRSVVIQFTIFLSAENQESTPSQTHLPKRVAHKRRSVERELTSSQNICLSRISQLQNKDLHRGHECSKSRDLKNLKINQNNPSNIKTETLQPCRSQEPLGKLANMIAFTNNNTQLTN